MNHRFSLATSWLTCTMAVPLLLTGSCEKGPELPAVAEAWVKIGDDGRPLPPGAAGMHSCVLDERTGLMWEVKRNEPGLHDNTHTYSWYSTDRQVHMSDTGLPDGGKCAHSRCDTEAFVEAVNRAGLCHYHDWYLPVRNELMSLGDRRLSDSGLVIDTDFFVHTIPGEHWTAETFRLYPQAAWAVDMRHGLDRADRKTEAKPVRLVRRHQPPARDDT
jgi:hypothetical protein